MDILHQTQKSSGLELKKLLLLRKWSVAIVSTLAFFTVYYAVIEHARMDSDAIAEAE